MAVPKKRLSKARRDSRRAENFKLEAPNLSVCPNCKAPMMPHRVCPTCGQYKGKQIVNMESEAKKA
ncbi:MAG TPA: 50S ribosomal protein L32 [Symbiobacteriaceae bacterium]|jgi:large subunit ribosomal protein L32